MKLDYAVAVASEATTFLLSSKVADDIVPVGDIRRGRENVAKIELLVRPTTLKAVTLPLPGYETIVERKNEEFERFTAWLYREYRRGDPLAGNVPTRPTWKPVIRYRGVTMHLLICTPPRQWGIMLTLYTSPDTLAKRLINTRSSGGLMPDGWRVREEGAVVRDDGTLVVANTEEEFFAAYNLPYVSLSRRR